MSLKKILASGGLTIAKRFSNCKHLVAFAQEIEKTSTEISSKNYDVHGFVSQFEDLNSEPGCLDHSALKFVEDYIGMDLHQFMLPDRPNTQTNVLKVPGTELTFDKLKSLKKYVTALDKMLKEKGIKDYKDLFQSERTKGTMRTEEFM